MWIGKSKDRPKVGRPDRTETAGPRKFVGPVSVQIRSGLLQAFSLGPKGEIRLWPVDRNSKNTVERERDFVSEILKSHSLPYSPHSGGSKFRSSGISRKSSSRTFFHPASPLSSIRNPHPAFPASPGKVSSFRGPKGEIPPALPVFPFASYFSSIVPFSSYKNDWVRRRSLSQSYLFFLLFPSLLILSLLPLFFHSLLIMLSLPSFQFHVPSIFISSFFSLIFHSLSSLLLLSFSISFFSLISHSLSLLCYFFLSLYLSSLLFLTLSLICYFFLSLYLSSLLILH